MLELQLFSSLFIFPDHTSLVGRGLTVNEKGRGMKGRAGGRSSVEYKVLAGAKYFDLVNFPQ